MTSIGVLQEQAIVDALKQVYKGNEAILSAIKDKPLWEILAPGIYILIGALLSSLTQWIIFRLQRKKELELFENNRKLEINFKTAELFGKYKNLSTHFVLIFDYYNYKSVELERAYYLYSYYKTIRDDEEEMSVRDDIERDEIYNQVSYYTAQINTLNEIVKPNKEKYRIKKLRIMQLLHEIHFYSKDNELSLLIEEFQNKRLHKYLKPAKFDLEIASDLYFKNYTDEHLLKQHEEFVAIFQNISSRILALS